MRPCSYRLRFALVALMASLLIFSQYCTAAGNDEEASTSPVPTDEDEVRSSMMQNLFEQHRLVLLERRPRAHTYIQELNFHRIATLPSSFALHQDTRSNPTVPFYGRTPLFSVRARPAVVEQALRDYGSVGIVDAPRREAMQILREDHYLSQHAFPELLTVLTLFELDPKIHVLKKAVYGQLQQPPAETSVDEVPHARGIPILGPNHDTLGHMFAASKQDQRAFWLPQPRGRFLQIKPLSNPLFEVPDSETSAEIHRVLDAFAADKEEYGGALASLKWGRPLDRIRALRQFRITPPSLTEYRRFTSSTATRQQLIAALHTQGRFRLYLNQPGQLDKAYRVKLDLVATNNGPPRRQLVIEPLTKRERLIEKVFALVGRVHLPV